MFRVPFLEIEGPITVPAFLSKMGVYCCEAADESAGHLEPVISR